MNRGTARKLLNDSVSLRGFGLMIFEDLVDFLTEFAILAKHYKSSIISFSDDPVSFVRCSEMLIVSGKLSIMI